MISGVVVLLLLVVVVVVEGGGWSGVPDALDHELVYLARWRAEQLKISVLSGRGRVRGCGWVTLCGRGAASADMTAK